MYPFKKSTITSETDLPSDCAFAFAFAHTCSLTLTDLIFFPTITTPHIRSLNPNTNQETLHWVHQFQPTTSLPICGKAHKLKTQYRLRVLACHAL
jgi:hypothetical protein